MEFTRILDIEARLGPRKGGKSGFLFGPRATGKSHLLRHAFPDAHVVDLLDGDVYSRLLRRPRLLGEELQQLPRRPSWVVLDEIQKIPALLDEVHRLIENEKYRFVLTGSSARKLKRGGANLLAGRARTLELFPLVSKEIPKLDFERYLSFGGLPGVYLSDDPATDLRSYVTTYLKEEIQTEAIVRRVDHFARFLDVMGAQSGEELVFDAIASDAQVPPRTVANFVEVLKDTLLAFELEPFVRRSGKARRKAISRSKLYLFDVGVANALAGRLPIQIRTEPAGRAFEHWMIQEVRARLSYAGDQRKMTYWRTTDQNEVDLVIGDEAAYEIKFTQNVTDRHLKSLRAFKEEKAVRDHCVVCNEPRPRRTSDGIRILPWRVFLEELWG